MLVNNLLAAIVHIIISVFVMTIIGWQFNSNVNLITLQMSSAIVCLSELAVYILAGYHFPNKQSCAKNFLSVSFVSVALFISWILYVLFKSPEFFIAHGIPFILVFPEGLRPHLANSYVYLIFTMIPSLFMWLGLEIKRSLHF